MQKLMVGLMILVAGWLAAANSFAEQTQAAPAVAQKAVESDGAAQRLARLQAALASETPEDAVQGATDEVLNLIEAGRGYADADPERFYQEVEALINPMIDFRRFAKNVMGPVYRKATKDQRDRFAETFKWSLVKTYALALTDFVDGKVEVVKPRRPHREPDKANVVQEVTVGNRTYVAAYRMQRNKAMNWRVQNITIEGINVGSTFKTQFRSAMRDPAYGGDLDQVIDAWGGVIEAGAEQS